MSTPEQATLNASRHQKILDAVQSGLRTWDQLRAETKITEEGLGLSIGELLDLRKIWTGEKNGVRFYGLERRSGLVPRFSPPQRRSTDHT